MEIYEVIRKKENNAFRFKPNMIFFKEVGINRKRFYLILKKVVSPTIIELKSLAAYFQVPISSFID
jgi:hypothetical protein